MKARQQLEVESLTLNYRSEAIGRSHILHADAFEWLSRIPENSLHAIVTDPPYGVKEYNLDQIEKHRVSARFDARDEGQHVSARAGDRSGL
jgi:DNA modification methylase